MAIAQKALQERTADETRCVIVRGDEAQSYVRAGNRERVFSYVDEVVATAQEKCLTLEQRDRAKFVAGVLDRLLNFVKQENFEGKAYHVRRSANELVLEAKDRQEPIMIRAQGAIASTHLTSDDQKFFEQLDQSLGDKQKQKQKQGTPSQYRQSKIPQMEPGD